MAVTKIEIWKCSDGKEFSESHLANEHEDKLLLEQFVKTHIRFQDVTKDAEYCKMIAQMIYDNQSEIVKMMGWA